MATRAADSRSRRYDPAETRQRVLDAANMLFTTKGFVATGTADIARAADVSEGSIFYHFGSKKALLVELGRHYGERMIAAMQQGEPLETLTIADTIRRCFDYCAVTKQWETIANGGEECQAAGAHAHIVPEAEPFYESSREVVTGWTERHMRAHLAAEGRDDINVPVAASFVYATVHEALNRAFNAPISVEDRDAILRETIRFVSHACDYPRERAGA